MGKAKTRPTIIQSVGLRIRFTTGSFKQFGDLWIAPRTRFPASSAPSTMYAFEADSLHPHLSTTMS